MGAKPVPVISMFMVCLALIQSLKACPDLCSCTGTKVSCERQSLTVVPASIPTDTTDLSLSFNQLTNITGAFRELPNLHKLYLLNNRLKNVTGAFQGLGRLWELDLSFNQITNITAVFRGLSNLHELYLANNKITDITGVFQELSNLQRLLLHNNRITNISGAFRGLSNLQTLIMYSNRITDVTGVFQGMSNLRYLDIRNNSIICTCEIEEYLWATQRVEIEGSCKVTDTNAVYGLNDIARKNIQQRFCIRTNTAMDTSMDTSTPPTSHTSSTSTPTVDTGTHGRFPTKYIIIIIVCAVVVMVISVVTVVFIYKAKRRQTNGAGHATHGSSVPSDLTYGPQECSELNTDGDDQIELEHRNEATSRPELVRQSE